MKQLFSTILAVSLFFTIGFNHVLAEDDITGHIFEKQMRDLQQKGIMKGYGEGKFLPDKLVTRAEFAAFISRALELPDGKTTSFQDMLGHPIEKEVNRATAAGIINGVGNGLFAPDRHITREEMAVMVDRGIQYKGLIIEKGFLPFKDLHQIQYPEHVKRLVKLNVMPGFADHTFQPQRKVTRAETANTIYRMLRVIEEFEKEQAEKEKQESEDAESEKEDNNNKNEDGENERQSEELNVDEEDDVNEELEEGNQDRQISFDPDKETVAVAKSFLILYEADMETSVTYVASDTELKVLDIHDDRVKVQIADTIGYVDRSQVDIKNQSLNRSFYTVEDGDLIHYIYRNGKYVSYKFGPAPSFLDEGEVDFSWNGKTFTEGVAYHYFNYLPLHTKTSYSAEDLDRFIKEYQPESPLIGLGKVFKKAEEEVGVNALYLLAHAIHESAWGFSKIAREKHNLFGIRATDDNPYENAKEFDSFEDSILFAANYVKERYLTPKGASFYNGAFLGNKSVGMNVYYASDPYWGQKIAGHMYKADRLLGGKDWNKYSLAVTNVSSLNVRVEPEIGKKLLYQYDKPGMSMIVLDEIKTSEGTWYKIRSDQPDQEIAYVYGNGELGQFVARINRHIEDIPTYTAVN